MGMHDKPKYLTGDGGFVMVGETFYLWKARIDGTSNIGGSERPRAKLLVSRTTDGAREVVFTSGRGIVGQVQRIDAGDVKAMQDGGMHVRLDEIPPRQAGHNATHVLTPSDQPPAAEQPIGGDAPADF